MFRQWDQKDAVTYFLQCMMRLEISRKRLCSLNKASLATLVKSNLQS